MADLTPSGTHEPSLAASTFALVAANLLTIAAALWFDMRLKELFLVYWVQGVMIGIAFVVRLVFWIWRKSRDKPDDFFYVLFFLLHYGFFQLMYLLFLGKPAGGFVLFGGFGLCVLAFALSHAYSLWHSIRHDQAGNADVRTLFWMPYVRVLPMVLTVIFGDQLANAGGLLLFGAFKTVTDVLMHVVEHHILRAHVSR